MKKQILVCTVSPIFPVSSGGKIYTASTILPLSNEYDYHLISFYEEGDDSIITYEDNYKKYFKTYNFIKRPKMPHEMNLIGKVMFFSKHVINKLPLMDCSFYSNEVIKLAKKIVKEHGIDILELHNLHTAYIKKFFPNIPAVLCNQNIEGDIFPFWEPPIKSKLKTFIRHKIACSSRKNTNSVEIDNDFAFKIKSFISLSDMDRVKEDNCEKVYLPLAFEADENKIKNIFSGENVNILWMGGFGWYPNLEGMTWFAREIYPKVKEQNINNLEFHIIGGNPSDELKALDNGKDFFVHGWVESIDAYLEKADFMIVPLLSGSGVRVKIVEAMSNAIPVLSTHKGCEGLGVTDGENIIIRDDATEFANAIIEMAKNPEKLKEISKKSKEYILENHSIENCLNIKRDIYDQLLK